MTEKKTNDPAQCATCGNKASKQESRIRKDGSTWRRYVCSCGIKFSTVDDKLRGAWEMKGRHPLTRDILLDALRHVGPMTARELAEFTGIPRSSVNSAINHSREVAPRARFAIVEWRRAVGHKGSMAPVYKRGPGFDAPRPVIDKAEAMREYKARYKARHAAVLRVKSQAKAGSRLVGNPFAQLIHAAGATSFAAKMNVEAAA